MRKYAETYNLKGFETWSKKYKIEGEGSLNGKEGFIKINDRNYSHPSGLDLAEDQNSD